MGAAAGAAALVRARTGDGPDALAGARDRSRSADSRGVPVDLDLGELAWLADVRGLERSAPRRTAPELPLRLAGPAGGRPVASIEQPKRRLKAVAAPRAARDPRLHAARMSTLRVHPRSLGSHHARRTSASGSSCASTSRTSSPRSQAGRIYGIFRAAGYPEEVAHWLTALTTNVVPRAAWAAVPRRATLREITAPPPPRPPPRDAAPAARRADLARPRQPRRVRPRPPALRPRAARCRRRIRATPTTSRSPAGRCC